MIPKIIHFCWLSGDPFPPPIQQCIDSWKQKIPDYEFMLWDTKRIDVNSHPWLKKAMKTINMIYADSYAFIPYIIMAAISCMPMLRCSNNLYDLVHQKEFAGKNASGDIEAAVRGAGERLCRG